MSALFKSIANTRKVYRFGRATNITSFKYVLFRRSSDSSKKFLVFDDVVQQRRSEAQRSLVVQVNSVSSFKELYNYCSKYAEVNGIHHYRNSRDEHFMLIEFKSEENIRSIISNCSMHQKDLDVMPVRSPFLWFRTASGKKEKFTVPDGVALATTDGTEPINEDCMFDDLMKCSTVSDQIQLLYDRTVLNDLGVRLRYMVARHLEMVFDSVYSNIVVRPFGSSVNGFGKLGCDLDLTLTHAAVNEMAQSTKRLVYQEKKCEGGRSSWQRHMELVADLLETRAVGAARVLRILNARVPIVKYAHELTALECDMCYNNMSGVHMSELLWLYGSMDDRVRPLAFVVRRWAQAAGLTNRHPGRWITNFPLTLMVLFFLQTTKGAAVLPPLKSLVKSAGKDDVKIAEDNINCTFLRDLNKLPPNVYGNNTASLEELLLQFFEYYAQFDFNEKAISINEGSTIRKPNNAPLYIVNPLEQSLNVSRNVSYEECERLKLEVKNAAWHLETLYDETKSNEWGILGIVEKLSSRRLKKLINVGNSHRLLSVKDLFEEENKEELNKSKLQRLTSSGVSDKEIEERVKVMKKELNVEKERDGMKPAQLKYKNSSVRNAVRRIQRNKII